MPFSSTWHVARWSAPLYLYGTANLVSSIHVPPVPPFQSATRSGLPQWVILGKLTFVERPPEQHEIHARLRPLAVDGLCATRRGHEYRRHHQSLHGGQDLTDQEAPAGGDALK